MYILLDIVTINLGESDSAFDLFSFFKDLFLNALGAFLGFLGAWLIYRREQKDNARKEKAATLNRYREHVAYLQGTLTDVVKFVEDQTKLIDEFTDSVRETPTALHPISLIANTSVQRLVNADTQELYHAYNTLFAQQPNPTQQYRRFLRATDSIALNYKRMQELYEKYLTSTKERLYDFKRAMEQLANDLAVYLHELKQQPGYEQNPSFQELNTLMLRYVELNSAYPPMRVYYEEIIKPLKVIFFETLQLIQKTFCES